jgi:histidine triad (HIT) family protein
LPIVFSHNDRKVNILYYLKMKISDKSCVFCDQSHIAHQIVWETDQTLILVPHWPRCKGHLLFIPKIHTPNIVNLPDANLIDIFNQIRKGEKLLNLAYNAVDFNILTNQGELAMQSVFHLHFHLLPRFKIEKVDPLLLIGEDPSLKTTKTIFKVRNKLRSLL